MATLFDRMGDRYFNRSSNAETRNREPGFFENFGNIFTTLENKLEKDVRDHLRNVYATLSLTLLAATAGALGFFFMPQMFMLRGLFIVGTLGCMFALAFTPATRNNETKRLAFLMGVAVFSGYNLGPLLEVAIDVEPKLIFNAFMISGCVFGCFSFAALYADSNKFLHLGGIISSVLMCMLISTFFGGHTNPLFLWIGLAVSCALVLYDTQKIVYKKRIGDDDYIWHTLDLFLDFIDLFRYILIVLLKKEENSSSSSSKKKRSN